MANKARRLASARGAAAGASLASPEPWARVARGPELARAIERGREQEALWLLDDGVAPTSELLGPALCVGARGGLARLCRRLLALGASPRASWAEEPKLLGMGADAAMGAWVDASHGCAALAMRAGAVDLARLLLARGGAAALGPRGACAAALLRAGALARRLSPGAAREAFGMVAELVPAKARPGAAALLCSAGQAEQALWLLDSADEDRRAALARAMLAPLCAHLPDDPAWVPARDALARCVELSAGRSGSSIAASSPFELAAWSSGGADSRERRLLAFEDLAWRSCDFPSRALSERMACWPREAALACGNSAALEILEALPFAREEREAVRSGAERLLDVLDGRRDPDALPAFSPREGHARWTGAAPGEVLPGRDERAFARRALSLAESGDIGSSLDAARPRRLSTKQRREAEARREAEPSAPPRRARL